MTAEIFAITEHLVLRRMTSHDAEALAAYRSDRLAANRRVAPPALRGHSGSASIGKGRC